MKASVYNQKGEGLKKIELSEDVFGKKINKNLVYQVYTSLLSNRRKSLAFSKDRSEVRGGGKKPWRQKGTGRARHGSNRSPIWSGGGVTFGPRSKERNFTKKINKKIRQEAFKMVLSEKFRDGEVKIIESINSKGLKTNQMDKFFKKLLKIEKKFPKVLFLINSKNKELQKNIRNLSYIRVMNLENIDLIEILNNKYLILPEDILPILEKK